MNTDRTQAVYRYALKVAGRADDPLARELGPIHLLKYAYLVDLAYAQHHGGETFTGIDWVFHHFGPWSTVAHGLIAAAVAVSGIIEHRMPSSFGEDDFVRWKVDADYMATDCSAGELPLDVRGALERYVNMFGADTSNLLHYVYATTPMLKAAPGEHLRFGPLVPADTEDRPFVPLMSRLSTDARKNFSEKMSTLRQEFTERASTTARKSAVRRRWTDANFAETASWVDSLAGEVFPADEAEVEFADAVWHSEARQGHVCI